LKRRYPLQPIVGVGAVIVKDGQIVLVKRAAEPAKGKWSFPGGAVELGEKVRDAVVREALEECGLKVELADDKPIDAYDILTRDNGGRLKYHYVLLQFRVKPKAGELKPSSDAADARWVPLSEVENYDLADSVRSFLRKHRQELESPYSY